MDNSKSLLFCRRNSLCLYIRKKWKIKKVSAEETENILYLNGKKNVKWTIQNLYVGADKTNKKIHMSK